MEYVRQEKLTYLQPAWLPANGLAAGFTTRAGGGSRAPYNSLNLAYHVGDDASQVEANRARVTRSFGLSSHLLLTVKQVHGCDVLVVSEPNLELNHFCQVAADAIICNQPQILIGILTADCYPVLLYAPQRQAVAAVHVGWRGAAANVIGTTLKALQQEFACVPSDFHAAVGPGISAAHYTVDRQVREAFRDAGDLWSRISKEVALGQWQLDLKQCCQEQLQAAGVSPNCIETVDECTYAQKERFFSYRRDGEATGRQMGFIGLMNPEA